MMRKLFGAVGPTAYGFVTALQNHESHGGAREDCEEDGDFSRMRYRTIFISDLHLGTPGCQATALLDFSQGASQRAAVSGGRHR